MTCNYIHILKTFDKNKWFTLWWEPWMRENSYQKYKNFSNEIHLHWQYLTEVELRVRYDNYLIEYLS